MKLAQRLLEELPSEFTSGQRKLVGALNILKNHAQSMNRTLEAGNSKFKNSDEFTAVGKSAASVTGNLEVAIDITKSVRGMKSLNVESEKENKQRLIQSLRNIKMSFDAFMRIMNKTDDSHMKSALARLVKEYTGQLEDIMAAVRELKRD